MWMPKPVGVRPRKYSSADTEEVGDCYFNPAVGYLRKCAVIGVYTDGGSTGQT